MNEPITGAKERRFEYPLRYQLIRVAFLGALLLADFAICLSVVLTVRVLSGWTPPSHIRVPSQPSMVILNLLGFVLLNGILILVFSASPAIHVRNDKFRIRTLFYTSKWLDWTDIGDIKLHWLYNNIITVSVKEISPIYSLVGVFQLTGARAFLVFNEIDEYEELVGILREKRPELFPISR